MRKSTKNVVISPTPTLYIISQATKYTLRQMKCHLRTFLSPLSPTALALIPLQLSLWRISWFGWNSLSGERRSFSAVDFRDFLKRLCSWRMIARVGIYESSLIIRLANWPFGTFHSLRPCSDSCTEINEFNSTYNSIARWLRWARDEGTMALYSLTPFTRK